MPAAIIDLSMFASSSLPGVQLDGGSFSIEPIIQKDIGRIGAEVRMDGKGFIQGTDFASLATAAAALSEYCLSSGRDFLIYGPSETTLFGITAANCIEGGPHIAFKIDDENTGGNYRRVTFNVRAKTATDLILNSFKVKTDTKPNGLRVVTQSGVLVGLGSGGLFNAEVLSPFKQQYPAANWIVQYDLTNPYGGTTSAGQLQSTYTVTATEIANPLPSGGGATAVSGSANFRRDRDGNGRLTKTYSYDLVFTGGDYQSLANAMRPDSDFIIHESISYSSISEQRLSASFTVLDSADGDGLLNWSATLVFQKAVATWVVSTYPGAQPIMLMQPATLPRLIQTGSATGLGKFPKEADPVANLDTFEQQPSPRYVQLNDYEFQTTWEYHLIWGNDGDPDIASMLASLGRPDQPDFYGGDGGGDGE